MSKEKIKDRMFAILLFCLGILTFVNIITIFCIPKTISVYEHEFVKEINHGDNWTIRPSEIITTIKVKCEYHKSDGEVITLTMCEECWEGMDCYQKVIDTTWISRKDSYEELGLPKDSSEFCSDIIDIGFFTIISNEVISFQEKNNVSSYEAYKMLFNNKCLDTESKTWDIENRRYV